MRRIEKKITPSDTRYLLAVSVCLWIESFGFRLEVWIEIHS